jgi:hypothetical protein
VGNWENENERMRNGRMGELEKWRNGEMENGKIGRLEKWKSGRVGE